MFSKRKKTKTKKTIRKRENNKKKIKKHSDTSVRDVNPIKNPYISARVIQIIV